MKNTVTSEIRSATNLVVNEAKRALEDRKTNVFIVALGINIFLWGLFLSEWRQATNEIQDLKDKQDTTMVYVHSLETKLAKFMEQSK